MKSVPRVAAQLAALVCLATVLCAPVRADELQDANRLMKEKQYALALDRVNQFLARNPRDARARFLKGVILSEQKRIPEAIEVFRKLTEDYPELPEPYNNLAVLYAAQGQYEKARQELEMSIRTHPSYATAYENLGDVYAKLASQAYDKALQLDSANPSAKNKLSLIRELISSNAVRAPATSAAARASETNSAPGGAPSESAAPKPVPEPKRAAQQDRAAARPTKANDTAAVLDAVRAWAEAWSKKDIAAYLAFYASDFQPPRGESRTEWEKLRRQRISAPKSIQVTIEAPRVRLSGDNAAVVSFRQFYRSDHFKATSRKTLVMERSDGRWLIREERVEG